MDELYALSKVSDLEALFLKEVPAEIKRLSFPLLKKYLENKILVLSQKIMKMEKSYTGNDLSLITDYFNKREKDPSLFPYLYLRTQDQHLQAFITVCEDSESEIELKYPGGIFVEMRLQPNYLPALEQMTKKDFELRVYLERKKSKKVKIVNPKLDKKIETIKQDETERVKRKAAAYFAFLREYMESLSKVDLEKFEASQSKVIEEELRNYLKMELEGGTNFQGRSLDEITNIIKRRE